MRIVLGLGVALALGALILNLSHHAPRLAGTDYVPPDVFATALLGGQTLCQTVPLAANTASVQFLAGSYGRPLPAVDIRFVVGARLVAAGRLPQGTRQGEVVIPLAQTRVSLPATRMCLHLGPGNGVLVGGQGVPPGPQSATVDGQSRGALIALSYYRPGRESWWHLLPVLAGRFGVGKSPWFGAWTLAVAALALAGVWAATLWLLARATSK